MLMLWLAPGASVPAFDPAVIAKLLAFAPPSAIVLTVSGALPLFVSVTLWAAEVVPTF